MVTMVSPALTLGIVSASARGGGLRAGRATGMIGMERDPGWERELGVDGRGEATPRPPPGSRTDGRRHGLRCSGLARLPRRAPAWGAGPPPPARRAPARAGA